MFTQMDPGPPGAWTMSGRVLAGPLGDESGKETVRLAAERTLACPELR